MDSPPLRDYWRIALNLGGALPWLGGVLTDFIDPIGVDLIEAFPDLQAFDLTIGNHTFVTISHVKQGPVATPWMRFENSIRLRGLQLMRPFQTGDTLNKLAIFGDVADLSGGFSAQGRIWRDTRGQGVLTRARHGTGLAWSNGIVNGAGITYGVLRELAPGEKVAITLANLAKTAGATVDIVVADNDVGLNEVSILKSNGKAFVSNATMFVAAGPATKFILLKSDGVNDAVGYIQGYDVPILPDNAFYHTTQELTANGGTAYSTLKQISNGAQILIDRISVQKGGATNATVGTAAGAGGAGFVPLVQAATDDRCEQGNWRVFAPNPGSIFVLLKNVAPGGGPWPVTASISGRTI